MSTDPTDPSTDEPEDVDDPNAADDDPPPDDGADQLGDAGKRALAKERERVKTERNKRKDLERQLAEAKKPPDGDPVDVDAIRKQARDEAATEALKDRVIDKIEAKARKFADSEDAAAILLRSHTVDDFIDDGKVDATAITEALDELAEAKPHLVAKGAQSAGFDTGRGRKSAKAQLDKGDLSGMSQEQINKARKDGRLDRLMGKA
jgi:hypothetical protein